MKLVFTLGYASPHDDAFVEETIRTVEGHGGALAFVRLYCDTPMLEKRVVAGGRRQFGKITSAESLRQVLASWNVAAAIPFRESLEIDNSALEPAAAARRIAAHFSLTKTTASPPAGPEPSR